MRPVFAVFKVAPAARNHDDSVKDRTAARCVDQRRTAFRQSRFRGGACHATAVCFRAAAWLRACALLTSSCRGDDDSALRERASAAGSPATATAPSTPPADARFVELRLALDPEIEYRVTTVGMIAFPMVDKPTGFAREEDLALTDCEGDGFARACTLQHRYGRFEAEPPTGKLIEADEARVRELTTRHTLVATGLRRGPTVVDGPEPARTSVIGESLADAHRFYCLRFPGEAVAVGAKWSDECRFVHAGGLARQNVAWELSKLDDDPIAGRRAELSVVGELVLPGNSAPQGREDETGERKGTVQGTLWFFVDRGQPHLLRLRTVVPLDAGSKLSTTTTLNVQFARRMPDGSVVRTDDRPFPSEPAPDPAAEGRGTR
jgi:hypothetical protein